MLKRIIDFSLSLVALLLLSAPMVVLAVLLLAFNKGAGAFFTQTRTGKNAKLFQIIKFKTMTDERDAEGKLWPDEVRMTPVGRFVRSTSLDELPQLINVLKGEMSLVGPRPLLEKYLPLYSREQFRRHEVKPGITGWAQVNGRNALSWDEKFKYDVWYVENISFLLDVKIMMLTIRKVFNRDGISGAGMVTMNPFTGYPKINNE